MIDGWGEHNVKLRIKEPVHENNEIMKIMILLVANATNFYK